MEDQSSPPSSHRPVPTIAASKSPSSEASAFYDTIGKIVEAIPVSFRPTLSPFLTTLATTSEKSSHASEAIRSFKQHQTAKTFPPSLNAVHPPSIQCSKEFTATSDHSTLTADLNEQVENAKKALLAQMIAIKERELEFFIQDCTNLSKCAATFKSKVVAAQLLVNEAYGGKKHVPAQLITDYQATIDLAELLCSRAIQCGFAAHQSVLEKRMRKLSLKKQVDVTMTGDSVDTATIEKVVNMALDKRNKAASTKRKRSSSKEPSSPTRRSQHANNGSSDRRETSSEKAEAKGPLARVKVQAKRQRRRQEIQEEVQALMDAREPHFRVRNAYSYPDAFLDSTEFARFCFVVINTPVSWFETIRSSKPGVHKHPSVNLPHEVEYALALNLKHIFHTKPNFSLPSMAFEELTRSVRIRWAMRNKEDDGSFIPKFHLRSSWIPPIAAPHIEAGLAAGKSELLSQVPYMSPQTTSSNAQIQDRMSIGPAYRYLIDHRLLCLITDKNLGIAVVPASWYDYELRQHIMSGPYAYEPLETSTDIEDIHTRLLAVNLKSLPDQLHKFIFNQPVPIDVPTIYGIPKIHKNPWALRPIVPAHNWFTANIGKVVDHLLQPLMRQSFPWILNSTRDVCSAISALHDRSFPFVEFITGDVTAMYTNISQEGILETLRKTFEYFNSDGSFFTTGIESFILEAVAFINSNVYFQYRGLQFRQNDGIAMGSPCAPVLANIYLGWYEFINGSHLNHLFYGRFIDDIICIRTAQTSEPSAFPQRLDASASDAKLEITWKREKESCVFLDLTVYHSVDKIHTRLFSKALNHYQYIPWSSAHPVSVKKGFCKAELLRFLVASSTPESFAGTRQTFWHHLHARGYPTTVLTRWFKLVTWEMRSVVLLKKKDDRAPPLMLPGQYNPIWDFVLVRRIRDSMLAEWSRGFVPAPLQDRLITSLSRTDSLFDFTRKWNKRILILQYQDNTSVKND